MSKAPTKHCVVCGKVFKIASVKNRYGGRGYFTAHKYCSLKCGRKASYLKGMLSPRFRLGKLVAMAKNRATEKKLLFDLDVDYMLEMWEEQEGKCVISGRAFKLEAGDKRVNPDTPSIDRIVPAIGYVKGNVRLVTYHVNVCLSEFGDDELYKLAADILGVSYRG